MQYEVTPAIGSASALNLCAGAVMFFRNCEGQPMWLWAILVMSPILMLATSAHAHDTWISRKQFQDPTSGAWCCDEHDCAPLDDRDVQRNGSGFIIEGQHFVSGERLLPSGDERYWACFNSEGTGPHDRARGVRCLFVPLSS
jgi:hypothetical protein